MSEGKMFFAGVSVAQLRALCKGSWQEPALSGQAGLAELRGISIFTLCLSHSQK